MKSETEIREMLDHARKERDSYPSGDGEFVWQDGFMSALMTVLDDATAKAESRTDDYDESPERRAEHADHIRDLKEDR